MSAEPVAVSAADAATGVGAPSETAGFVRSSVKVVAGENVGPLPATSVTATRTWTGPSGVPGAGLQTPVNGAPFVSASTVVNDEAPVGFTWNATEATPDVTSVALAARGVVDPPMFAPAAGAVTVAPAGAVLSIVFAESETVVVLPAVSVTMISRS